MDFRFIHEGKAETKEVEGLLTSLKETKRFVVYVMDNRDWKFGTNHLISIPDETNPVHLYLFMIDINHVYEYSKLSNSNSFNGKKKKYI